MSTTRKSSRRQRASESLEEHLEEGQSYDPEPDEEDDDDDKGTAESWSSHDISAGAAREVRRGNRRASATGGRRSGSPSSNRSLKSDRSNRSGGSRDSRRRPEEGDDIQTTPQRPRRGMPPKSPATRSGSGDGGSVTSGGSSGQRASMRDSSANVSANSSSNSLGSSGNEKLTRILELGNKWKTMKQQHEQAMKHANSRRLDLTKEVL